MFLVIQSIPLGLETRNELREAGATTIQHHEVLSPDLVREYARNAEFVLNMGNSQLPWQTIPFVPIVNMPYDINLTRTPGAARLLLGDLMPERPSDSHQFPVDAWIKAPGQRGRGKFKKAIDWPLVLPSEWDVQKHVDGTEYRVITVGHRAVQGFVRTRGTRRREYTWTGLENTPDNVLALARTAAGRLPHNTLRAWDCILEDGTNKPFILESNSSPGMKLPTIQRVVTEIKRQISEERITTNA